MISLSLSGWILEELKLALQQGSQVTFYFFGGQVKLKKFHKYLFILAVFFFPQNKDPDNSRQLTLDAELLHASFDCRTLAGCIN